MSLLLVVLACSPPRLDLAADSSATLGDTAAGDSAGDSAAACPTLVFDPASVELPPTTVVAVAIEGCAEAYTVACPDWATLELPPAPVEGGAALVEAVPGWSGDLVGECRVTSPEGVAVLGLRLVVR